jgi:glycosyltransferase involved in cell wall biosynthesis
MRGSARPTLVYVDPFAAGHHAEHLAFYLRVCAGLGAALRAHVPAQSWRAARRIAGGGADSALLARDVHVPDRNFRGLSETLKVALDDARENAAALYFPMMDNFLGPLALRGLRGGLRRPWSGVYYRDTFNYPQDEAARPGARLRSQAKLWALRRAVADNPCGILTFNADWRAPMPAPVVWLPDALSSLDRRAEREADAGWPLPKPHAQDDRLRLLLFGALGRRKGLVELVEGLLRLDDKDLVRIELKALGRFAADEADYKARAQALLSALAGRGAKVELADQYVPEDVLDEALRWCDVILAPYISHLGSSGVVGLATQYGRPLLAQSLYQVGDEVRRFGLGLTVDPTDPAAVAAAVRQLLDGEVGVTAGMAELRRERNSVRAFETASTAIRNLFAAAA